MPSWDGVVSFYARLCGVVYVTRGGFGKGSEKGTTSMHQILYKSWEKCYRDPRNDSTRLRGPKLESYSGMPGSRPVAHQLTTNTPGVPQVAQLLKPLHEFKRSFVRIDVGPFVTLLRRCTLVMGHANVF